MTLCVYAFDHTLPTKDFCFDGLHLNDIKLTEWKKYNCANSKK